jgi:hypothetical protein
MQEKQPEPATALTICPRCHGPLGKHLATSRADNRTHVCSLCGTSEALIIVGVSQADYARVLLAVAKAEEKEQRKP